jgi:hypothetical protein
MFPEQTNFIRGDKLVRLYADGGTNVDFFIERTNTGTGFGRISISGYLVDLP